MSELRVPNVNSLTISGRLTKDFEVRYTPSGTAVASFDIANNKRFLKNDEWQDEVSYFSVTVFGKRAESCGNMLNKGSAVLIEGSIKQDRWKDKEDRNRDKVKINASKVHFLEKQNAYNQEQEPTIGKDPEPLAGIDDDNIPF